MSKQSERNLKCFNVRITNILIDEGWSSTWARDFIMRNEIQTFLKILFKHLAHEKKRDCCKFMRTFK